MSFASDQLYNGYLRRNMPTIVSKVKAREIVIHLPCLTAHDRETIEAKRETSGNFNAMGLLLECLKRRENWPEQFIEALEACEHRTIAAEIRREYDALRGVNNPKPSSPPTTVVTAHVHPPPPTFHVSLPDNAADGQAAAPSPPAQPLPSLEVQLQAPQASVVQAPAVQASVVQAPAVQASVVQAPAVQASGVQASVVQASVVQASGVQASGVQAPVVQASGVQAPVAPVVPVVPVVQAPVVQAPPPPPEPAPEPPQVAPPPSTPPPSPATPHPSANATPRPQREVNAHQEPEENSESDPQDDESPVNAVENHVPPPPQSPPVEQQEPASPSCTTSTVDRRSPPPVTHLDMMDGSALLQRTPEKAPVQDTAPPVDRVPPVVLEPQETSDAPSAPVVETSPQSEPTAPASAPPTGTDTSACDEAEVCLSKPGVLVSVQPQYNGDVTVPASSTVEEQLPYSGDSERLEMSSAMTTDHTPACSAAANTPSAPPCQENGIAHNEPEEDYYESATQSLNQVVVNQFHFAEEPPIPNLDGPTPPPQPQIINGEAAKAAPPIPPTIIINAAENHHPPEPASDPKTLQDWEEKPAPRGPSATTKYILTAAGVGACALLVAWRLKN